MTAVAVPLVIACMALAGSLLNFLVMASKVSSFPSRLEKLEATVSSSAMVAIPVRIGVLDDRITQAEITARETARDVQNIKVVQASFEARAAENFRTA